MSADNETQIEHSLSNVDPPTDNAPPAKADTSPAQPVTNPAPAPSEFKEPALERRHTLTGYGGPKPTGNLVVTVHQGKGIYNTAFTGVQNVYSMIRCGKSELQSKTVQKGGTDPVFEEKFQIQLNGSEKRFSLELYSSGMLFDGWIGRMTVRVEELPNMLGTRWHRIGRGDFDKYPAGEVMLSIELNGNKGDILSSMASTLFSSPSRKDSGSKPAGPATGNSNTVSSLAISRGTPMLSISTAPAAAATITEVPAAAAASSSSADAKPALPALPPPTTKASRIPEELMSPLWQQHQNEAGVPYYYNKITRQSVWELPEDGRIARH